MIPAFEFATATRVVFGPGALHQVGAIVEALGRRALVVSGRSAARAERLISLVRARGIVVETFVVSREPDLALVRAGTIVAREHRCDVVIGVGGGSVLDAAKAIAVLATNDGDVFDYLEVIGRGRPLSRPSLACVAIPTTAGTGSEVTRNAVLASPAHRVKVSLRSPLMLPRVAVVDPELTHDLPAALTATTGLDALTQLIEPYLSPRANPMTDALCADGFRRVSGALRVAVREPHDAVARQDMALASTFGGMALANAGLGAVHGFAGPIGGMFDAPHGAICAALLPRVLAANHRAISARPGPDSQHVLRRFDDVARLVTGRESATTTDAVRWLEDLLTELRIPGLATYGLAPRDIPDIAEKAAQASSMKGNPVELTRDELSDILTAAL